MLMRICMCMRYMCAYIDMNGNAYDGVGVDVCVCGCGCGC